MSIETDLTGGQALDYDGLDKVIARICHAPDVFYKEQYRIDPDGNDVVAMANRIKDGPPALGLLRKWFGLEVDDSEFSFKMYNAWVGFSRYLRAIYSESAVVLETDIEFVERRLSSQRHHMLLESAAASEQDLVISGEIQRMLDKLAFTSVDHLEEFLAEASARLGGGPV